MQLPHPDLRNARVPRRPNILPPASIAEQRPCFIKVLDYLGAEKSVVLDDIGAGLFPQRNPFEGIFDVIIMLSIFDKSVRDAETTLKILNMHWRRRRERVDSTCI